MYEWYEWLALQYLSSSKVIEVVINVGSKERDKFSFRLYNDKIYLLYNLSA